MIAWTIAQIALLGTLLALAAWGAESALRAAGRPTRWAWVGALLTTLALAALTPMRATTGQAAPTVTMLPESGVTSGLTAAPDGLLATLHESWTRITALGARGVQEAWAMWHAAVPAGTERVLLAAWIIASIALLTVFVLVHLRFARRRAQWPVGTLHDTAVRIASDTGPAVIGVTRAEIVVPQWLLSRDDREQQLVLAHEREHVRVRDPLLLALAQAVIVLLPWHPAVWWMASRLRLAVELDCDRRVLERGASPRAYGTLLIDLTDHRTGFGVALPAFSCTPSHLERRLIAMTPTKLRYPLVRVLSTGALASLALLAACEAKLPTNADVSAMTAASATTAAGQVVLLDTSKVTYYVNDVLTPKAQAEAIKPENIASINVNKRGDGTGEVRITYLKAGQPKGGTYRTQADSVIVLKRADGVTVTSGASDASKAPFTGLLIVDGVARESSSMNSIKPDDIATVNVIKGPAATAKYNDPRAANGVIEIVTKAAAKP